MHSVNAYAAPKRDRKGLNASNVADPKIEIQPRRIQRKRTRGWRKPADAIVVSRPSRWGNPFRVGDQATLVRLFEQWLVNSDDPRAQWMRANLRLLRGHDLACWCEPGEPCHADVLLRLANGG